jgi:hypothetical protein
MKQNNLKIVVLWDLTPYIWVTTKVHDVTYYTTVLFTFIATLRTLIIWFRAIVARNMRVAANT